MKVVWICPFNLNDLNKLLEIDTNFSTTERPVPWIYSFLKELKNIPELELHVITTSREISKDFYYSKGNQSFYILKKEAPFFSFKNYKKSSSPIFYYLLKILLYLPKIIHSSYIFFEKYTCYYFFTLKVSRIIRKIKPVLVHAHGTEYLWSAPLIRINLPKIITIQGFTVNSIFGNESVSEKLVKRNEEKVLRKIDNYIVRSKFMEDLIKSYNPKSKFWYMSYIIDHDIFSNIPVTKHDSDIVFAARIKKDKGIEDLIKACSIIKKEYPSFKLKILGLCQKEYMDYLKNLAVKLEVIDNINFVGFIKERKKLLFEVKKSKISVLPTYHDTTPSTITEAIYLGVAIVAYNTGGIPDMVKNNESAFLVNAGDIDNLAFSIIKLLKNDSLREQFCSKALADAKENFLFNNSLVIPSLLKCYKELIALNQ